MTEPPDALPPLEELSAELLTALEAAQAEGLAPNARRWLHLVGAKKGAWIEAQALDVPERGTYRSNRFAHASDSATLVTLLAEGDAFGGVGVYFVANCIDPQVATRQPPGRWHVAKKGESTSDRDIRARAVFYVDVDVERPSGTSATDAQVLEAHQRGVAIYHQLAELLGARDALAFGHSGNGRSIFVALDYLPETPELRTTVKGILAALRALYEGGGVKIDQTVSEAKRLVPAWGTVKRKGAPGLAEYPHRRTALAVPEHVRRLGLQDLDQLLAGLRARLDAPQNAEVDKAMGKRPAVSPTRPPSSSSQPGNVGSLPLDEAKQVHVADVLAALGLVNGEHPVCPGCGLSGNSSVAIVGNGLKCSHERCSTKGVPGNPGFRTTIDLVMEALGLGLKEACQWLAERFGFAVVAPASGSRKGKAKMRSGKAPLETTEDRRDSDTGDESDADLPRVGSVPLKQGTADNTDLANAERFIAAYGSSAVWIAELGGWQCFVGTHWTRNADLAEQWAQKVARALLRDARTEHALATRTLAALKEQGAEPGAETAESPFAEAATEEGAEKAEAPVAAAPKKLAATPGLQKAEAHVAAAAARLAWAKKSQSARALLAMLRTAQCLQAASPGDFDQDPWLFNLQNGTVDLRTGELRPHRREDKISRLCPIVFDPKAQCPRWLAFLDEVQPDEAVRGLLHRLVGYSMTGTIREHVLVIQCGEGRNGKGVFMNTLLRLLGDYGTAVPPELVMIKRSDAHPTERTVLFGVRLASAQETEERRELNVSLVKTLTGGDPIRARRMYENFWQFQPTHKLWLITNHKPHISETKNAIWARVLLIRWLVEIPRARQDLGLIDRFVAEEGPGILAWAVRGCLEYQRMGLAPPPSVVAATQAYRNEEDPLAPFLDERCMCLPDARVTRSELRAAYLDWATSNGLTEKERLSADGLATKLRERGIDSASSVRHLGTHIPERGWRGIRLMTHSERLSSQAPEPPVATPDEEREAIQWEAETVN